MTSQSEQKRLVGKFSVDKLIQDGLIFSGMKIGLGTGSTAMSAVEHLAQKIADGTVKNIRAVSTSFQTTIACENLGIPVFSLNSREIEGSLDLAIDGADEISQEKHLIKGGGAALLLEKIVAYNSAKYVIIADESKIVSDLGTNFPLPIEIIPEARYSIVKAIEKLGGKCILREGVKKAGPVVTDNGNLIIDVLWSKDQTGKSPIKPSEMEKTLNSIIGVVENGFFTQKEAIIFIAHADGSVEQI